MALPIPNRYEPLLPMELLTHLCSFIDPQITNGVDSNFHDATDLDRRLHNIWRNSFPNKDFDKDRLKTYLKILPSTIDLTSALDAEFRTHIDALPRFSVERVRLLENFYKDQFLVQEIKDCPTLVSFLPKDTDTQSKATAIRNAYRNDPTFQATYNALAVRPFICEDSSDEDSLSTGFDLLEEL